MEDMVAAAEAGDVADEDRTFWWQVGGGREGKLGAKVGLVLEQVRGLHMGFNDAVTPEERLQGLNTNNLIMHICPPVFTSPVHIFFTVSFPFTSHSTSSCRSPHCTPFYCSPPPAIDFDIMNLHGDIQDLQYVLDIAHAAHADHASTDADGDNNGSRSDGADGGSNGDSKGSEGVKERLMLVLPDACSAIIKLLPGNADLLTAQATWTRLETMLRIYNPIVPLALPSHASHAAMLTMPFPPCHHAPMPPTHHAPRASYALCPSPSAAARPCFASTSQVSSPCGSFALWFLLPCCRYRFSPPLPPFLRSSLFVCPPPFSYAPLLSRMPPSFLVCPPPFSIYDFSFQLNPPININAAAAATSAADVIPGHAMSFASYPGRLFSGDDFYITSARLAIQETTIGNNNAELYRRYVRANGTVLEWIRNVVANRVASSGRQWVDVFSRHNSGTYNNQWMVVDYKLFLPGLPPPDDTLWVLEQLPGHIVAEDMSAHLRDEGYWASYNNPAFPAIFNLSGFADLERRHGSWFSHSQCPRAKLFRRDHGKVVGVASLQRLMRYNDFKHDPLSACNCTPPYSAEIAIAARGDLNEADGQYELPFLGLRDHAETDSKITGYHMLQHSLAALAISGPTYDQQPPFQWSKSPFANVSHLGHPDLFLFPWLAISYGTEGTGTEGTGTEGTGTEGTGTEGTSTEGTSTEGTSTEGTGSRLSVRVQPQPQQPGTADISPSAMVQRAPAESTRSSIESTRSSAEGTSGSTESTSGSTESTSGSTESTSGSTESTSGSTESTRSSAEGTRSSAEGTRGSRQFSVIHSTVDLQIARVHFTPYDRLPSLLITAVGSPDDHPRIAPCLRAPEEAGLLASPPHPPLPAERLLLPPPLPPLPSADFPTAPALLRFPSLRQSGRQLRSQKPGESPSLPNGGSPKSRGRKRGSSDGEMDAKRRRSGEKGKGGELAEALGGKVGGLGLDRWERKEEGEKGKGEEGEERGGADVNGKAGKEGEAGKGGEEGVAEETVKLEKADEAAEREDEGDADEEQGGSGEESPTGEEQQRRGARRARGEGRGGAGGASRGAGARGRGRGARGRGGKAGAGLVSPDRPMSPGGAAGAGKGRGPRKRSPAPPIHADGETGGAGKGGRGGGGAGVAGAAGGAGRGGEELQDVVHEAGAAGSGIVRDEKALDSVVKVFCVHTDPNFSLPWQRKRQYSSNSSGFIIENRRVLTNAHSVEHHTQVKVKKRGSDTKYLATVLAVGTECDIALLSVEDDEFWKDVQPLKLGSLPHLQVWLGSLPHLQVWLGSLPHLQVWLGSLPHLQVWLGSLPHLQVWLGSLPHLQVWLGSLPHLQVWLGSLPHLQVWLGSLPHLQVWLGSLPHLQVWLGSLPHLQVWLGSLPHLQDPVTVVGYPIGGDTISVTSGVVSRIEVTAYVHGASELLGVQIDAAINSEGALSPSAGPFTPLLPPTLFLHPALCPSPPLPQDPVTVVGYPIGGDTISVTSGVVSRIEVTAYVHGASELLGDPVTVVGYPIGGDTISVTSGVVSRIEDPVTVVGYPIGGDTISVTSGVVSRIEVTAYVHGASELLGVQIDAAINSGNSGGPAFNAAGECVGIAFQSMRGDEAENIGYIIPTPVIHHFISDYDRNGHYTGFPILGVEWQKMENPDMRKALGMEAGQKGVRVRRVEPTSPAAQLLQTSDILLSFDGVAVANDGTVPLRKGERIGFSYLVSQKYEGEMAQINVLRANKVLQLQVELPCTACPTPCPSAVLVTALRSPARPAFPSPSPALPPHPLSLPPVPFRKGERIGFSYLVSQKYEGETAQINVLRGGKVLQLQVELRRHKRMVPVHIAGLPPSYFIVAGIVFTWVTVPYLRAEVWEVSWGKVRAEGLEVGFQQHKRLVPVHIALLPPSYFIVVGFVLTWYGKDYDYDAPVKLLDKLMHRMRQSDDEQVVVISQVGSIPDVAAVWNIRQVTFKRLWTLLDRLMHHRRRQSDDEQVAVISQVLVADVNIGYEEVVKTQVLVADVNIGYEEVVNTQVVGFNGVPVKNLLQLARLVDQCTDPFMQFDLDYDQVLVLETAKAKDATPDILAIHSIPSHCSSDIKEGHLSTISAQRGFLPAVKGESPSTSPSPLFPDNSFSSQQWEEAYGLQKESLLPPEKISLPADVAAAPHLEACSEVSAHRLAAEQRGPNGESPEWARPKDCCGCNPQPPWVCMGGYDWVCMGVYGCVWVCMGVYGWIRGSDAANLGMTRVAQRDIWEHQFPPNRCEGRRLLIAHWAYIAHGIGSQLHIITAILSLAMRHNRTLVLQYPSFDRAKHDECNATGAWGSFNCYFFPLTSPDCEEIALNSNSTGALPPCCTPSTKEEVLASDHPIVCFHGEPFNGLQFEASIASQWDTAYLERPNMIELQGQVERDNPQHIKVHWWRSQALRFMLRWPSPYLCHLTNRIRHGAYGLRVATHTVQARDRSAALLRLYNDHLSAASPSSLPASASSTSLHPLSLNHSDPSFLTSADPSMQSRAWPGLGVASCSGSASSPGPAPSFRAYLTSLYEGVGREAYMPRPMVSLHIRQGDKGSEMKLSSFNSFMFYLHRLRLHVPDIRFVWISTEMQSVIDQSAQFKDWTFFYSQNERQLGDMRLIDYEKKAGRAQLVGVSFANLIISSECDYYVGVLGSNWNRLINEMRATSGRVFAGYVAINNGEF
ncbi:unnamed protein product [Closterium sp. NIES-65]|nr:unnamed protein product [Closterium sp. NIES-65]